MSQTVKIDEAAQAAIAEIVGMPWAKDYYDNTLDEDRDFLAQTEWVGVQMQRLNCEIKGTQNMWGYGFYVNGRHYEVHFTTNEIARTCVILNQAAKPIFQKVTEDVSKVSLDDAAFVLKTFLLSKIKENEECQSK